MDDFAGNLPSQLVDVQTCAYELLSHLRLARVLMHCPDLPFSLFLPTQYSNSLQRTLVFLPTFYFVLSTLRLHQYQLISEEGLENSRNAAVRATFEVLTQGLLLLILLIISEGWCIVGEIMTTSKKVVFGGKPSNMRVACCWSTTYRFFQSNSRCLIHFFSSFFYYYIIYIIIS